MKSKGIASEGAFPKSQKQAAFIVRPKHSQLKIMQPVLPAHLENKLVDNSQNMQKSLQFCLRALEQQITENIMMERSVSQKIKGQLLTLREKYIYQQQSYNQQEKEGRSQQVLRKNQSNKQLGRGKLSTEHQMNKQNGVEIASFLQSSKGKSLRSTNRGISGPVDEEHLKRKIIQLNRKLEKSELEKLSLRVQITKLESGLNSQAIGRIEKQALIDNLRHSKSEMQRTLHNTLNRLEQKEAIQCELRRSKEQLAIKLIVSQQKLATTQKYLKEREVQAINLWQTLQAK